MGSKTWTRYPWFVMLVVVVLTLSGCGGEEEPEIDPVDLSPPTPEETPAAPDPTPEPEPEAATPQTYVVQQGDTLSQIAARFGTTVDAIMAANDIADPDRVFVGDELIVPPPGDPPEPQEPETEAGPEGEDDDADTA